MASPTGSRENRPKQWHTGWRPLIRLTATATLTTTGSVSAAIAAGVLDGPNSSAVAIASSVPVSIQATGPARRAGTPNAITDCRLPRRSASLAVPLISSTTASATDITPIIQQPLGIGLRIICARPVCQPVEMPHRQQRTTTIDRRGELVVEADPRRPSGRLLRQAGMEASYVDLADATHLEFDYIRWLRIVLRAARARRVLHVGGGACALARALAAEDPGGRQEVCELDADVLAVAREHLGLRSAPACGSDWPRAGLTSRRTAITAGTRSSSMRSSARWCRHRCSPPRP